LALAKAWLVAVDLALQLFTKLERIGRYDPSTLKEMALRICADGAYQGGYPIDGAGGGT